MVPQLCSLIIQGESGKADSECNKPEDRVALGQFSEHCCISNAHQLAQENSLLL